jgi:hypothetical protein
LSAGDYIELYGLKKKQDPNGKRGTLQNCIGTVRGATRWAVALVGAKNKNKNKNTNKKPASMSIAEANFKFVLKAEEMPQSEFYPPGEFGGPSGWGGGAGGAPWPFT